MSRSLTVRPAEARRDVETIREAYVLASGGLAPYAWERMAQFEGIGTDEMARRRILSHLGTPDRLVLIAEMGADPAGVLICYPIGAEPEPTEGEPEVFVPLIVLENAALNSFYVNVLTVFAPFRRRGIAMRLLEEAAARAGRRPLSLIVSNANETAIAAYRKFGFGEADRRPMAKGEWDGDGTAWVLMIRP